MLPVIICIGVLPSLWYPLRQAFHLGQSVMPLLAEECIRAWSFIKPARGCWPFMTFPFYSCVLAHLQQLLGYETQVRKLQLFKAAPWVPGHLMILPINGSCSKTENQQLFIYFTVRLQGGLKRYFSSTLGFILPCFVMLPLRVRN